jgi:hypothetical protein
MRAWARARVGRLCGGCGAPLEVGDPILVITIARGTRPPRHFIRCAACEGPAPPDLPAVVATAPGATGPPLIYPPGWPYGGADWRARASGAREPGEDG